MSKTQVIYCPGGKMFAACLVPYCYEEADWQRDMRKYVKSGCKVEVVDSEEVRVQLCQCECDKPKAPCQIKTEPTLFQELEATEAVHEAGSKSANRKFAEEER